MSAERLQEPAGAESPSTPAVRSGRYDSGARRRSRRTGRQRGCTVYIAAEELVAAGYDPDDPPPYYRVWGSSRGGLFVRLYKEA